MTIDRFVRCLGVAGACAPIVLLAAGFYSSDLLGQGPAVWTKARLAEDSWNGAYRAAFAYDEVRQRVVAFGAGVGDETREWDGFRLRSCAPPQRPSARTGHALAYDAARQRVVLLGGRSDGVPQTDTWEWDGGTWTAKTPLTRPPARSEHALAFDPTRQRLLLFGGRGAGGDLGDTWEWDGVTWIQAAQPSSTTPNARSGHTLTFDPLRQRVILFGGVDAGGERDDTWEWDGARWSQVLPASSPRPRSGHVVAQDLRGRLVLFGGGYATPMGRVELFDTWEWDGTTWTQVPVTPSPVVAHAMVYDAARQRTVLLGHVWPTNAESREIWEWDGRAWSLRDTSLTPVPWGFAPMTYDTARQRLVLVVGSRYPSVVWECDGRAWTLYHPTAPVDAYAAQLWYDAAHQRVGLHCLNGTTWEWSGSDWTQRSSLGPQGRLFTAIAYDVARRQAVMFGGRSRSSVGGVGGDTWLWDGNLWSRANVSINPPAREHHALAYDAARQRVVLFGGHDGNQSLTDTWEWDGVRWTQVPTAVQPTSNGRMVYDAGRGRVVLIAGGPGGAGCWEWDGATWWQVTAAAPIGEAVAYDAGRGRVALFGSEGTWLYGASAPPSAQPFGTGCPGRNGTPLLTSQLPYLGHATFSLDLLSAAPSSPCLLVLAAAPDRLALGAGCTLWVKQPIVVAGVMSNASGFASLTIGVPEVPALRGQPCFAQGITLDVSAPLAAAFSAGRALTLGD